ncbi:MAG: hypothetical protein V2I76_09010, partial [Roseobacter sp.]|nr:hypothetical protein [Roseobacter sp.]
EPRDEFCVDPVGSCPRASAGCEGFDLRWRQLPGRDPGTVKGGPQSPFLHAAPREIDPSDRFLILAALKADKGIL